MIEHDWFRLVIDAGLPVIVGTSALFIPSLRNVSIYVRMTEVVACLPFVWYQFFRRAVSSNREHLLNAEFDGLR
jgi:hypothetical protein